MVKRQDPPDLKRAETVEKGHGRIEIRRIAVRTKLPADKLDPAALLQLARDHWQIENRLFHVRDVTFKEHACRVRTGSAPQVLAELRNATLTLIRRTGQKPRPAREAFAEQKWKAIRLVMAS